MMFPTLLVALIASLASAADICEWEGEAGPVGVGNPKCAGSDGNEHSDVLWCPSTGTRDRLCGANDVNEKVRDNCKFIRGPSTYCTTGGKQNDSCDEPCMQCYCINGNFCCDAIAEVPGGDHPVDYYKSEGCHCDG